MENNYQVTKLEREEFSSALRKGLGRALLHVVNFGLENVNDLVLDACLYNYCYDAQIESSRASWLFQMFGNSEYYPKFSEAIFEKLKSETNLDNLGQLCALAKEMAKHGDETAKQRLRESVFEKASTPMADDWMGRHEWVDLEGTKGFLELAKVYGHRLLLYSEDFVPDDLVHWGKAENELRDVLYQIPDTEVEIKVYRDYLEARGVFKEHSTSVDQEAIKQKRRERVRKEHTIESILRDAKNKAGNFPGRYTLFGRYATKEELEQIYNQLFIETDKDILVRLLWVFRHTPLPRLDELVFKWATRIDDDLRNASINALAQVSDEQVHRLATSKVKAGELLGADNDSLALFINNLEDSDINVIHNALNSLKPDAEDVHSLGFSILKLAEKHQKSELANLLKWVYKNTSCSNCRYRAIKQLHVSQKLDNEVLYECQFDAEEDIRNFAKENIT